MYSPPSPAEGLGKPGAERLQQSCAESGRSLLEALRPALDKAAGLDEIFHKHMENKSGKLTEKQIEKLDNLGMR